MHISVYIISIDHIHYIYYTIQAHWYYKHYIHVFCYMLTPPIHLPCCLHLYTALSTPLHTTTLLSTSLHCSFYTSTFLSLSTYTYSALYLSTLLSLHCLSLHPIHLHSLYTYPKQSTFLYQQYLIWKKILSPNI